MLNLNNVCVSLPRTILYDAKYLIYMTLKEFFEKDRFAKLAGAELLDIREGYAKARMLITEEHLNGGGICQGGAVFTFSHSLLLQTLHILKASLLATYMQRLRKLSITHACHMLKLG